MALLSDDEDDRNRCKNDVEGDKLGPDSDTDPSNILVK